MLMVRTVTPTLCLLVPQHTLSTSARLVTLHCDLHTYSWVLFDYVRAVPLLQSFLTQSIQISFFSPVQLCSLEPFCHSFKFNVNFNPTQLYIDMTVGRLIMATRAWFFLPSA